MKGIFRIVAVLPAMLLLCGCLTLEQVVEFRENGTVELTYQVSYPEQTEEAAREVLALLGESSASGKTFLSRENVQRYLAPMKNRAILELFKEDTAGGVHTVKIVILLLEPEALRAERFGVSCSGGVFSAAVPGKYAGMTLEEHPLVALCKDAKVKLTLKTFRKIQSGTGHAVGENGMYWLWQPGMPIPGNIRAIW